MFDFLRFHLENFPVCKVSIEKNSILSFVPGLEKKDKGDIGYSWIESFLIKDPYPEANEGIFFKEVRRHLSRWSFINKQDDPREVINSPYYQYTLSSVKKRTLDEASCRRYIEFNGYLVFCKPEDSAFDMFSTSYLTLDENGPNSAAHNIVKLYKLKEARAFNIKFFKELRTALINNNMPFEHWVK